MIQRSLRSYLESRLFKGKALLVFGPRQVGKSTLIESLLETQDYLYLNGDDADIRELFFQSTATQLRALVGNKRIVFIDEAQRITNIGLTLKIFTDQLKHV